MTCTVIHSQKKARFITVFAAFTMALWAVTLCGYLALKPQLDHVSHLISASRSVFIGSGAMLAVASVIFLLLRFIRAHKGSSDASETSGAIMLLILAITVASLIWFICDAGLLLLKF